MTRDEYREACLKAMEKAWFVYFGEHGPLVHAGMTAALDALHGLARVVPIEATEEMVAEVSDPDISYEACFEAWHDMSTAGDLTNAPEGQP